jgi:hypothetical protein
MAEPDYKYCRNCHLISPLAQWEILSRRGECPDCGTHIPVSKVSAAPKTPASKEGTHYLKCFICRRITPRYEWRDWLCPECGRGFLASALFSDPPSG